LDHKAPPAIANSLLTIEERTWGDEENPDANNAHRAHPKGQGEKDKGKIEKALPGRDGLLVTERS
jgi:hypothetical protein